VLSSGGAGNPCTWEAAGGGNRLDEAYDQDGKGVGRAINVDGGPVNIIHSSDAASTPALDITYKALANTGTPHGINVDLTTATSFTNAGDIYGVNCIGATNAGGGNTYGLYIDRNWDRGLWCGEQAYFDCSDSEQFVTRMVQRTAEGDAAIRLEVNDTTVMDTFAQTWQLGIDNSSNDDFILAEGAFAASTNRIVVGPAASADASIELICNSDHVYSQNTTGAKFMLDINPAWAQQMLHNWNSNTSMNGDGVLNSMTWDDATSQGDTGDSDGPYFNQETDALVDDYADANSIRQIYGSSRPLCFFKFSNASTSGFRGFVGLSGNSAATGNDEVANQVGLKICASDADRDQTNWHFYTNLAATSSDWVDTGYPPTSEAMYFVLDWYKPGFADLTLLDRDYTILATTTFSDNLPAQNTAMYWSAGVRARVGAVRNFRHYQHTMYLRGRA
jgi:hypothetical protein